MTWRVGVDSGGTFTDVCLFDEATGRVTVWKVSTLSDLGVSVRLAALQGRIDLGVKGQDDKLSVIRMWLSGDESKLSRSLLY